MQNRPIYWAQLNPDEVENLPSHIKEAPGESTAGFEDEWIVLHAPAGPMRSLIDKLNRLHGMFPQGIADTSRERYLDRALELLLAADSGPEGDLAVENLEMRRSYVKKTPMLAAAQIHRLSGLRSKNKSVPASRWKAEGKIFAVRMTGRDQYPQFQFENGAPRPVIKNILVALPENLTAWQTALWFASANGWLNGGRPQDFLDNVEAVINAAYQLANPAIG